jgi:DNA polymerase-3 subunit delta
MAIYFYYGEEDFNIEIEVNKLKKSLDKNFMDMSFKVYDNPKFPELISILRTQPMMFGKMLIVIRCLEYFSKTFEDKEIKEITSALEDNNENLDIVFVAQLPRDEGKKLDSRKKFFKLLSKYNAVEFSTIPTYKTAELEAWTKKQAQTKKLKMSQDALTAIISQIGNNLRQIDNELEKLRIIAYPDNLVTGNMVKENCISNEDLFAFSDYLMIGERDSALKEYRKLLDKKFCLEITSALQKMLGQWIVMKAKASQLSTFELAKELGMNEYRVKLTLQKLKKSNLKDLVKLKENITEAEYKIKSGQSLNPDSEIENAIFK